MSWPTTTSRTLTLCLFAGWTLACLGGCSGNPLRHPVRATFEAGAEGAREVAEGPGMFSGEKGGWEFDLLDILHSRARVRASEGTREEGPE